MADETRYTSESFLAMVADRDDVTRYELLNAELIESPLFSYTQAYVLTQLYARLSYHGDTNDLGYTFDSQQGYVLGDTTVLYSTLSFVANDRIDGRVSSPMQGAPSIVIEIVSSADALDFVKTKLEVYFKHGAEMVWIIFADEARAEIHTLDDNELQVEALGFGDTLTAPDLLPDFEQPLYTLFPAKRI